MRKLMILVLSVTVILSCNNEKTSGNKEDGKPGSEKDGNTTKDDSDGKIDRNSGKYDDVVDDDEDGNHVADKSNWTSSEKDEYMKSCVKNATGRSRDWAETYCSCTLVKMQDKYPDSRDVKDFSLTSSWAQDMVADCKAEAERSAPKVNTSTSKKGWSQKEIMEFVDECVPAAMKNGLGELDAQSYCDCMQYKIEKIYPDYAEANRSVNMNTASMKRMVQDCLTAD